MTRRIPITEIVVPEEGDLSRASALCLNIFEATSAYTSDDFLRNLCVTLCDVCGVRVAFVTELMLGLTRGRLLTGWKDGQTLIPGEYEMEGTACYEVMTNGTAAYSKAVAAKFPMDEWMANLNAETYVGVLLKANSGDPLGIIGIVDDVPARQLETLITVLQRIAPRAAGELERRQRESALRRGETRLRLLTEYSKDILFYCKLKPEINFEYVSPAVMAITGFPPEAYYANPEMAMQQLHEEDRPLVRKAISSASEESITARITHADGQQHWIEYRNFPFHNAEGELIAVGGSIRDVTRHVEAEEEVRLGEQYRGALLEAIPDALFRLDSNGVLLDLPATGGLKDVIASSKAMVGHNIADLLPASFADSIMRLIHAAVRSGHLQRIEFEVASGNSSRFYEARCLPFGGKGVLLILRDFTAVKWHETEEERWRLRDEIDTRVEKRIKTNPYGLTYRELAVLHLVAEGSADKQIAEALGISTYTVNKHVGNILGKLNAASRTEAGVRAIKEGLVE